MRAVVGAVLFLVVLPYFAGRTLFIWLRLCPITLRPRSLSDYLENVLFGMFLEWAALEIIALPLILKQWPFSYVVWMWLVVLLGVAALGIGTVLLRDRRDASSQKQVSQPKTPWSKPGKILLLLIVLVIGLQCVVYLFGQHIDADDSRFVVNAMEAYTHDVLFTRNPATGDYIGFGYQEFSKDAVAPWSLYPALLARLSGIHPTVLSHTILPPLYLLLSYGIFWMMGRLLWKNDRDKSLLFVFFVAVLCLFFEGQTYSQADFMLLRLWQGKAVLAALGIPLIFWIFMSLWEEERMALAWTLPVVNLGCCLLSSMSIILASVPIAVLGLYTLIRLRSIRLLPPLLLSALPTICIGITYTRL